MEERLFARHNEGAREQTFHVPRFQSQEQKNEATQRYICFLNVTR